MADRLPFGRAQRVGGLTDRRRDRAQRLARREDNDRQDQKRQDQSARQDASVQMHHPDEQSQTEDPVNDGRHAGQVGDIDLNEIRQSVSPRVFFQINARADPQRNGEDRRRDHDPDRPHPGGKNTGLFRFAGRIAREKIPADPMKPVHKYVDDQRGQDQQTEQGRRQSCGLKSGIDLFIEFPLLINLLKTPLQFKTDDV